MTMTMLSPPINFNRSFGKRMNLHKKNILCLLLLLIDMGSNSFVCQAQQDNIWMFGQHMGIDFNSGTPVPIYSATTSTTGEYASVCSRHGQLLFYTNGSTVWGYNHLPMANGLDLTGLGTSDIGRDGVLIAPYPGVPDKYYIFSITRGPGFKLFYSIVDMSLSNGVGDVVAGQKSILLDTNVKFSEGVAGADCNIWIITHDRNTNAFHAFEITNSGINTTPVTSNSGDLFFYNWPNGDFYLGELVASPGRNKLALGHNSGYGNGGAAEVFDFNPATGNVSNGIMVGGTITGSLNTYDLAFSPDNTKLYVGNSGDGTVYPPGTYQIELPGLTTATLPALIDIREASLKLGPAKKIYMLLPWTPDPDSIGVIKSPDLSGNACDFVPDLFAFLPNTAGFRFPNDLPVMYYHDTLTTATEKSICFDVDSILITAAHPGGFDYEWSDHFVSKQRWVKTPGTYILNYFSYAPCAYYADTFIIQQANFSFSLGNDTAFCNMHSVHLEANIPGATYLWQDGSMNNTYTATTTGDYALTATLKGCSLSDTIHLKLTDVTQQLGQDEMICSGTPVNIRLQANVPPGAVATWNTGVQADFIDITSPGTYWVTVFDTPCIGSDTLLIEEQICDCAVNMPSAFTPNNDGRNDLLRPVIEQGCMITGYSFSVYNRWGERVFHGQNPLSGWDGTWKGMPAETGSYMYVVEMQVGTDRRSYQNKGDVLLLR